MQHFKMHSKQDCTNIYNPDISQYQLLNRIDRLEEIVSNLTAVVKKQQEKEIKMQKEISNHKKLIAHLLKQVPQESNEQSNKQFNGINYEQKSHAIDKNVSFYSQKPQITTDFNRADTYVNQNVNKNYPRSISTNSRKQELRKSELNLGASLSSVSGSKILMNQLIDLEEKQVTLQGNLTGSYVDYETLRANNQHKKNLYGIIYDLQRLNKPDYEKNENRLDSSDEFDENYKARRDDALDIFTRIEYLQQKIDNPVGRYEK